MSNLVLYLQTPEGTISRTVSGARMIIGRGEDADWRIDDAGLSDRHATIHREGEHIWITDDLLSGRVRVNGQPAPPSGTALKNGDEIILGDETIIHVGSQSGAGYAPSPQTRQPQIDRARPVKTRPPATDSENRALVSVIAALSVLFVIGGTIVARRVFNNGSSPHPSQTPTIEPTTTTPTFDPSPSISLIVGPPPQKLYLVMSEPERAAFVRQQAMAISMAISNSPAPYQFNDWVINKIKEYVDQYAKRTRNDCFLNEVNVDCSRLEILGATNKCFPVERLDSLLGRARCYAPFINQAFNDPKHVAPKVVGLYLAMIESEYHRCIGSTAGARGMFQFLPSTAKIYGVTNPDDMCKPEIMAPAAAEYIVDRMAQFGTDNMSITLAIAGYNRGPGSVQKDVHKVLLGEKEADAKFKQNKNERAFWTLIENSGELDKYFNGENIKYVPKFFAAATVGETPSAFGVNLKPLSYYSTLESTR